MYIPKVLLPCLLLILPLPVHAFSVNPMSVEIDPDQPNAQKLFVLSNTSDKDVPVEVRVARPVVDANGNETLEMGVGEDEFVILPQQLILPPGARRSVKVSYVGDNDGTEETYRILFRQVPVDLPAANEPTNADRPTFNMQVVLQYHTRVWITPKGLKEKLTVARFAAKEALVAPAVQNQDETVLTAAEPSPQPVLEVVIANAGGRHAYLLEPKLVALTAQGAEVALPESMVKPMLGQVVLPGRDRAFLLPLGGDMPPLQDIRELRLVLGRP